MVRRQAASGVNPVEPASPVRPSTRRVQRRDSVTTVHRSNVLRFLAIFACVAAFSIVYKVNRTGSKAASGPVASEGAPTHQNHPKTNKVATGKSQTPVNIPTRSLHEHLKAVDRRKRSGDAVGALQYARSVVAAANSSANRRAALSVQASLERQLRLHADAYSSHRAAFELEGQLGATAGQYLISFTEMITDRYLGFEFDQALELLNHTRAVLQGKISPEGEGLLHKMEAFVRYCTGDFSAAVRAMGAGRALPSTSQTAAQRGLDTIRHLLYVRCVLTSLRRKSQQQGATGSIKEAHTEAISGPDDAATMRMYSALLQNLTAEVASVKKWKRTDQLPVDYAPTLTARPWHTRDEWPTLGNLFDLLESHTPELLAEYRRLRENDLLVRDQDCIQHPEGAQWSRFEVNGVTSELGADGCSVHTPVACGLFDRLRQASPVRLTRLGYSALRAQSWIKPHYGRTNKVLKLHLGLVVPGGGCATMRVGNVTKAWRSGKVLMLDDSFEHEVFNDCNDERVVVQLVMGHPEIPSDPQAKSVIFDSH